MYDKYMCVANELCNKMWNLCILHNVEFYSKRSIIID